MPKHIAVFGGFGALGRNLIKAIKQKNHIAISIDLKPNSDAHHSVILPNSSNWVDDSQHVEQEIINILQNSSRSSENKLDAVVNVAGGFVMGNFAQKNILSQVDLMWKVSVESSVLSSQMAAKYMKEGGLLVLPGASGALGPTPGTIAYGISKSAVHHLVKSLANPELAGLPAKSIAVGIVPSMLDTEANRQAMPNEDFSNWTPLDAVSQQILTWVDNYDQRPQSGSLIKVITHKGETTFEKI